MSQGQSLSICVTGGAGFIGSHVVEGLLAAGHRVEVIDDLSSGKREHLPSGVPLHVLDIRSPEAAAVVEGGRFEVLVHLAAQMELRRSVEQPAFDADVNILGTLNLLEAARKAGTKQVIFSSTGGAIYGEAEDLPLDESAGTRPLSPYGVAKLAVENYLFVYHANYGLDVASLRYANVYGERQSPHGEAGVVAIFLGKLLHDQAPTINGDGLQTRDYVHVSDVVRANVAAVGRRGFHVYNVGTGVETSVVELYEALQKALGKTLAALHGPAKTGEQRRSAISPAKIVRELGIPEPIGLAEGLAPTAAWFAARA